jgi:hypothetical protein
LAICSGVFGSEALGLATGLLAEGAVGFSEGFAAGLTGGFAGGDCAKEILQTKRKAAMVYFFIETKSYQSFNRKCLAKVMP